MGLDELFAPYVGTVVELVQLPDEALIPHNYYVEGRTQDGNWAMTWEYDPADAPAAPAGVTLNEVYKMTVSGQSSSFVFALPAEYRYNTPEYPYLKILAYAPGKDRFPGSFSRYQGFWFRMMNYLWAYPANSIYGQEEWDLPYPAATIPDSSLGKWYEFSVDLSNADDKHTRIVVCNIGGEPWLGTPWEEDPSLEITYYFANMRFSKEP
ncbi:MAG: hypothetical protein LUG98_12385 [Tannerellaceae bacterium]|nr:hypothetical protein [Tannerellaceae bacterium]